MENIKDKLPDDWTPTEVELFCRLYRHFASSQKAFTHPDADDVPDQYWSTTAWNCAWMCIDTQRAEPGTRFVHFDDKERLIGAEPDMRMMN